MSLENFIVGIHCTVAFFMIIVVLVQGGNSGGVGAAFGGGGGGGGNSGGVLGTGATSFFAKLTYGAALIFMCTSIVLTVYSSKSGNIGIGESLQQRSVPEESQLEPGTQEPAMGDEAPVEPTE